MREPITGRLATYRVVLIRDPSQRLLHVARTLMDLTRWAHAEATHAMWEVHHLGRSVVMQTHLERAELYAEQLADRGLTVALERA